MAGLQSGEGRIMIVSVVWAKYINVTNRHRQTHGHVAAAMAAVRYQQAAEMNSLAKTADAKMCIISCDHSELSV